MSSAAPEPLARAISLLEAGCPEEALAEVRAAIASQSPTPHLLNVEAVCLRRLGKVAAAIASYQAALQLAPTSPELHNNLGNAWLEEAEENAVIACYQRAIALAPNYSDPHFSLGNIALQHQRYAEAEGHFRTVTALNPANLEAWNNLANAVREQGRLSEAASHYEAALQLNPQHAAVHYNYAWAHFLGGDLAAGGTHYEYRWQLDDFLPRRGAYPHIRPLKRGESVAGLSLLLTHEQGLGDTLQFLRFAFYLHQQGARVQLEVQPRLAWLAEIISEFPVFATGAATGPVMADAKASLMSLPYLLGLDYSNLPSLVPYLHPPASLWPLPPSSGPRVGLFWQGNPKAKVDKGRSFPLQALAPVLAVPGVEFISLQTFDGVEQLASLSPTQRITQLGPAYAANSEAAFRDFARIIPQLDLLITLDSAAAHMAGALGCPAWVMLRKVPEWRWQLHGERTPWYPQHRLFRQVVNGDWSHPAAMMAQELREIGPQHDRSGRRTSAEKP